MEAGQVQQQSRFTGILCDFVPQQQSFSRYSGMPCLYGWLFYLSVYLIFFINIFLPGVFVD
jgi:hypothetical protein